MQGRCGGLRVSATLPCTTAAPESPLLRVHSSYGASFVAASSSRPLDTGALDLRLRPVGAFAAGQRVAGRGRDLAGGPAFHGRDRAHARQRRRRARALLPAYARAVRPVRARHRRPAAAVGGGHGGGRVLCGGPRPPAGRSVGGPRGRAGPRAAAGRAVLPPGGAAVRPGRGRGRDLHPAPGHPAGGAGPGGALGRVRRDGRAGRPAELALAHDPPGPPGDPALDPGGPRHRQALDGRRRGRCDLCAAAGPVQPEPVRAGVLDTAVDLAHADRPRDPAGHRRRRRPPRPPPGGRLPCGRDSAGPAPVGPPPGAAALGGGRRAAAAGGAAAGPRRTLPDPAAVPGPVRPLQPAGPRPADRRGHRRGGRGRGASPPAGRALGPPRGDGRGGGGPAAPGTGQAVPGEPGGRRPHRRRGHTADEEARRRGAVHPGGPAGHPTRLPGRLRGAPGHSAGAEPGGVRHPEGHGGAAGPDTGGDAGPATDPAGDGRPRSGTPARHRTGEGEVLRAAHPLQARRRPTGPGTPGDGLRAAYGNPPPSGD